MASLLLFLLRIAILFLSCPLIHAQNSNLSTSTPVPPLQWINLSNLLQGSAKPPPLKDAAIGYDEASRSLIIFGGLSESGIAQSQTFLLDLQTLSWSVPNPPDNLKRTPPARSAVVSGGDFAASNRHGFVIIGGKGADGQALSDIWEYDFNNQFWSEVAMSPGGPSPRWGAAGGIDTRTASVQDPVLPGPNNTFFLAGGFDGKTTSSLSDVWKLSISGTLSSNLPDAVSGSWEHVPIGKLPGRMEEAGAVISTQIVSAGGCDSTATPTASNNTCAKQDAFIIDVQRETTVSPGFCPAPRVGPVLVPNPNAFSTSFQSQVYFLLGTSNSTLWQDSNGLNRGEVAILDINTGTWTRIIPSGDVDASGTQQFPSPREGATAISFAQSLVGNSRTISADTIVFGGQDGNGNFLSDLWLLRAYSGVITPSSLTWSGFGDGHLQTGVNADGSGVVIQYLTECATFVPPKTSPVSPSSGASSPTSSSPSNTASSTSTSSPDGSASTLHHPHLFETAFIHKLLLPLSVVLLLPILSLFRWTSTDTAQMGPDLASQWAATGSSSRTRSAVLDLAAVLLGIAAYGIGVVGFILSFTTISSSSSTGSLHLKTGHGIAGLLFFLCLYVLVPLLYLASFACGRPRIHSYGDSFSQQSETVKSNSFEANEKAADSAAPGRPRSATPSLPLVNGASPPSSPGPRQRAMSWDASTALRPNNDEGGLSGESTPSPTPHKFEVIRPSRARKLSEPWQAYSSGNGNQNSHTIPRSNNLNPPQRVPSTRRLGEIDWLLRRRSLNTVGELDYAITQAHNSRYLANFADGDDRAADAPMHAFPSRPSIILRHVLLQISILGVCTVILVALFARAPRYFFALFLVWTVAYYAAMILLAYHGRPASSSMLAATIRRLRGQPSAPVVDASSTPTPSSLQGGPYRLHRPPVARASTQLDEQSYLNSNPLSVNSQENEDDDEMDDDERQRAIEEEMERRDVSIVTVPRRKLYLTNPS